MERKWECRFNNRMIFLQRIVIKEKQNLLRVILLIQIQLQKNGFNENNIITLTDKQATKKGIEAAFNNLANRVKSGDVIYFHFSGHGQLITDLNNDERDEYGDLIGYDTALIPYDACRKYDPIKYRGENHIIDDELNEWLHLIKSKIGNTFVRSN